jgi:uncharacterized protein
MSEAVLEKMIRGYLSTPQPVYTFGWQGGEPLLLGVNFFRKITDLQKKHGRAGTRIANGIQTNATLIDDAAAEHFARYRFLVGCSLDGPAHMHDRYRRTRGGGPSHAAVLKGINLLERHRVEFNILVLVTQANVHHPKEVYRYLVDQGFYYHQYIPCVEFDETGTLLPFAVTGRQWGDFMCEIFDLWYYRDRQTVSVRYFDSILQKLIDGSCHICTLGDNCCQYFVVEYNGDIYPCDFFVREDLKLGNIMDMSWGEALISPLYNDFGIRKSRCNPMCMTCDYRDLCMGDCLKHRLYGSPEARNMSWLCAGWRQLIRHTRDKLQDIADGIRGSQIRAEQIVLRSKAGRRRVGSSPGRNQPCPCGSGRKYKKCCGR